MVKLETPIDLHNPFYLHFSSTFQAVIIDCLLLLFYSPSAGSSLGSPPSPPASTGAGGGDVGQLSITKSKYSNFISTLNKIYVKAQL
jgi:hypothetical protein